MLSIYQHITSSGKQVDDSGGLRSKEELDQRLQHVQHVYTLIALIFTLGGSFFSAMSFTLMKYSINRNQRLRTNLPVYLQKFWMTGLCTSLFGVACNTLAISFGNILLLSSSSAFTMIFNMLMARFILKEDFNVKWDGLAIFLVCCGSGLCIAFSKNEGDAHHYTEAALYHLYLEPRSVVYITSIFSYIAFSSRFGAVVRRKVWQVYFLIEEKFEQAQR